MRGREWYRREREREGWDLGLGLTTHSAAALQHEQASRAACNAGRARRRTWPLVRLKAASKGPGVVNTSGYMKDSSPYSSTMLFCSGVPGRREREQERCDNGAGAGAQVWVRRVDWRGNAVSEHEKHVRRVGCVCCTLQQELQAQQCGRALLHSPAAARAARRTRQQQHVAARDAAQRLGGECGGVAHAVALVQHEVSPAQAGLRVRVGGCGWVGGVVVGGMVMSKWR